MSRLRWTARAHRDLLEIGRFIARNDPQAAGRWVAALRKRAGAAAAVPGTGRRVPELDGDDDVREVVFRGYRIVYRVEKGGISVLVVFESHRQFPGQAGK